MSKLVSADARRVRPEHVFLFDTNVWLYLYDPNPAEQRKPHVAAYAELFKAVQARHASVVINFLVLSEFVNRIIHQEFRLLQLQFPSLRDIKRDFRETEAFVPVKAKISSLVNNQLLRHARAVDDLPPLPLEATLRTSLDRGVDLNDVALARCCQAGGYVFVSHDADMARLDEDIEVWTANRRVLPGGQGPR